MSDSNDEALQPMPAAKRRRLQEWFDKASKMMANGQYDYAVVLFTNCVLGDPGNFIYVSSFLGNLQRKYNNNKKGSRMAAVRGVGVKGSMKKAVLRKNWLGVIKQGLEYLKLNPWDANTLMTLADACEQLGFDTAQVAYLKAALEVDIKNIDVNRALARACERQGDFDAAILCWTRVKKAKPSDEEASKGLNNCEVKNTIKTAGYDEAESTTDVMVDKQSQDQRRGGVQVTEVQKLERAIKKNPEDVALYIELADLYFRNEQYNEAEEQLMQALEVSGGDVSIRERLEDAQIRRLRENVSIAQKRAKEEDTDEARELHQKYLDELNHSEMEMYVSRSERYPNNMAYKFELGLRLQRAGKTNEAIKVLQDARADPQRKGEVLLHLGECFQEIKQYRLALTHYKDALEELSERHVELRKRALYRAGYLAIGMKELDDAEEHLSTLAGLDFSYRDVAGLLDKIRKLREEQEEQKEQDA